ncbi:MAG: GNAT family N-acetyltransferase [Candidatus Methanomethylophilaceae archaeon]
MRLELRTMRPEDAALLVSWAGLEGWNPGLEDARIFHAVDPQGWFGAYIDGELCGGAVATNYGHRFSFGGFYIVLPEHRRSGIGWSLTEMAMEHAGDRCFGIDGVLGMEDRYSQRMRLVTAYQNVRWEGRKGILSRPSGLRQWQDVSWRELVDFDAAHFPAHRESFLRDWLNQEWSRSLVALDARGGVAAMGTLRTCMVGHKIGPLFANSPESAHSVLEGLVHGIPGPFYLDVPEPNREGMRMAASLGMEPVLRTARMYSSAPPELPLQEVFGVTSSELG